MKKDETTIWVYADWAPLEEPQLMGILTAQHLRGKEIFSFEYNDTWLNANQPILYLDTPVYN